MVYTFSLLLFVIFSVFRAGSRTLSKPAVRKIILELLSPLDYHLESMPEDEGCAVQEDIASVAVKYCITLTDNLVPMDE